MSMQRSLAQLEQECMKRSITLPTGKYGKKELITLLANYHRSLVEPVCWGLARRMEVQSPMLCFAFWNLRPEEKVSIMESSRWIAEKKIDGARLWLCYHPDEGFTFFSRNISVEDYLPVEYTEKVLLIKDGKVMKPGDFKGVYKKAFILDAEALANGNVDTSAFTHGGVMTETELNATTAILSLEASASHKVQIEQAQLEFFVFDVVYYGDGGPTGWVTKQILEWRKQLQKKLTDVLSKTLPFFENPYVTVDKQKFYDDTVAAGGEGIVLKNLDKAYLTTDSRPRNVQIKGKISVGEEQGSDIDAYIIGFIPSDPEKGWRDYIGAFKMGVCLKKADGTEEMDYWLASVGSMPLTVRKDATVMVDGKPSLNPKYLGRVLVINGQDVSARALRFMHATADWKRGFRDADKTHLDCNMDEEFLKGQVK